MQWAELLEHLGSKGRRQYTPAMREFITNPPELPPPLQIPRGVRSTPAPVQAAEEVAAPAVEAAAPHVPDFENYLRDAKMDLLNREAHSPDVQHRAGRMESWWRKAIDTPEPLSDAVRAQLETRPGSFMLKAYDSLHPQRFPESYPAAVEDAAALHDAPLQAAREPSTTWAHGSDVPLKPEVAAMVNEQAAARNINHASQLPGSYDDLTQRVRSAPEAAPAAAQTPAEVNRYGHPVVGAPLGTSDVNRVRGQMQDVTPTERLGAEPHLTPMDVAEAPPGAEVRGVGSPRDPANLEQTQYSAIALARAAMRHRGVPQQQLDELQDLATALAGKGRVYRDLHVPAQHGIVEDLARQVTERAGSPVFQPSLGRDVLEYPPTGAVRPHEAVADNLTVPEYQANRETAREVNQGARTQLDRAIDRDRGSFPDFHAIRDDGPQRSVLAKRLLDDLSHQEELAAEQGPSEYYAYSQAQQQMGQQALRDVEDYTDPWNRLALDRPGSDMYILGLAHADMQGIPLNKWERELVRQYENVGRTG